MDIKAKKESALKARRVFNVFMCILGLSMVFFSSTNFSDVHPKIAFLCISMHMVAIMAVYSCYWKSKSNAIYNQILKEVS